jgi:hypothetical protein
MADNDGFAALADWIRPQIVNRCTCSACSVYRGVMEKMRDIRAAEIRREDAQALDAHRRAHEHSGSTAS